jgi:hypothetical protein
MVLEDALGTQDFIKAYRIIKEMVKRSKPVY